jgi:hypothetical protein
MLETTGTIEITKAAAKKEPETRTLKELFKYPEIYEDCLQLLRDINEPALNENRYIGKNKWVLVVWYLALEKKGVIETVVNDMQRAAILTNTFENFSVSEGQFRQDNIRASNNHKDEFYKDILNLKLKKH